jgi:hypothetical protein
MEAMRANSMSAVRDPACMRMYRPSRPTARQPVSFQPVQPSCGNKGRICGEEKSVASIRRVINSAFRFLLYCSSYLFQLIGTSRTSHPHPCGPCNLLGYDRAATERISQSDGRLGAFRPTASAIVYMLQMRRCTLANNTGYTSSQASIQSGIMKCPFLGTRQPGISPYTHPLPTTSFMRNLNSFWPSLAQCTCKICIVTTLPAALAVHASFFVLLQSHPSSSIPLTLTLG